MIYQCCEGQALQKLFALCGQLAASPVDGSFSCLAKSYWFFESCGGAVVIAGNTQDFAFADDLDALVWVGMVTDDVAKTHDPVDTLGFNLLKHGGQCFHVCVNVGNNCISHW